MDNNDAYLQDWHWWYSDSNLASVKEFVEIGGNPNYQIYHGFTIFHRAVGNPFDNIEIVRELINAGANVNHRSHLDVTPLHIAVSYRKRRVINELIQSGASVNAQDLNGETPLHRALIKWILPVPSTSFSFPPDMLIIDKLLKHESIDCNLVNSNGETPLMVAVKDQHLVAVDMLLGKAANPNIPNNDFDTPLHVACGQPSHITIRLLLGGANIYSVNKIGQTPLDILIKEVSNWGWNDFILCILKTIAFKYTITSDLKRKFEVVPYLSEFFTSCCEEIDYMRRDFILDNLNVHDFIWNIVDDSDLEDILLDLHKPLVERLARTFYSKYFIEILDMIPERSLLSILQMTACSKMSTVAEGGTKNLADLFSIFDLIYLFSKYLWNVDIFCLIVAFSDVIYPDYMCESYDSYLLHIFD